MRRLTAAAIVVCAFFSFAGDCVDRNVNGITDPDDPNDSGNTDVNPQGDVDNFPPKDGEFCNGIDDDGDGLIDEGFDDLDGDGIADCVDEDCFIEVPRAATVRIEPQCSAGDTSGSVDPWDVTVEWRWDGLRFESGNLYDNILMAPIVGNLTDDNFDGVIDRFDDPEIITVAFEEPEDPSGFLVVLDGATGAVLLQQLDWAPFGGIVVADIDLDGETEIVGFDADGHPKAIRGDGTLLRQSIDTVTSTMFATWSTSGRTATAVSRSWPTTSCWTARRASACTGPRSTTRSSGACPPSETSTWTGSKSS